MKVSNKQKEQARNADLLRFMQDNYPDRIKQDGKTWRDAIYPDITIWKSTIDGQYKFKAHAKTTEAINEDIKGSDTIAYLRRFLDYTYPNAVIALCEY